VHLADIVAGLGAQNLLADVGEGLDAAGAVGAELAVILGPDFALEHFLDVAAGADPVGAQLGEAGHDVDAGGAVGIGAGGVVDAQGGLATAGLEVDFAHGDAERADMDLAGAADRAGGDLQLGSGGDVGHIRSPFADGERVRPHSLPTPVSAGSGSAGR
jgi:hypothetical protein